MNESWIRRMVNLVEESDIRELEFSGIFRKIRISKNGTSSHAAPVVYSAPSAPSNPVHTPSTTPKKSDTNPPAAQDPSLITSPMVGTFYRASSPEDKPFVEVGDTVEIGQTLCIIEAMKIMNEIQTERAGILKEVLVDNASPVEYGTPLFRIE